jgi:hypothetical protein
MENKEHVKLPTVVEEVNTDVALPVGGCAVDM